MYDRPYISVIIPSLNEEKNISSCLNAICNKQKTKVAYEVILVDNSSSDKTVQNAKKYNVKIIKEKRKGRATARQRGVEEARGEIIAFTEADCIVSPDWLEIISAYFRNNHLVVGVGGRYCFYNSTPFLTFIAPINIFLIEKIYKLLTGNYSFRGTNFAVRKEIFKIVGPFDGRFAPMDDIEFGKRVALVGPIHFLPNLMVQTADRRVRGRKLRFLWELISTYTRVFLLKRKGNDDLYEPIR